MSTSLARCVARLGQARSISTVKSSTRALPKNVTANRAPVATLVQASLRRFNAVQRSKALASLVKCTRSYSTTPSKDAESSARFELDSQKRLRIVLPLPSVGVTAFVLRPTETLGSLLREMRSEDGKIESLIFFYEDGRRVAHTTTMADLVKSNLVIELNGAKHELKASEGGELEAVQTNELKSFGNLVEAGVLTVDDLDTLMKRAYFYKIRQRVESDPRKTISVEEFYRWANEFGLSEEDAQVLLRALHTSAVVQHFETNATLAKHIFLKPDELLYSVASSLDLQLLSKADGTNLAALKRVQRDIAELDQEKAKYDGIARTHANRLMFGLFVYLLFQFGVLADMVWIDFNWDIMEPITYFVTLTTVIGGFSFFIKSKRDYTYPALAERFANSKLRKLYIANRFPYKTWATLDQQRSSLLAKLQTSSSHSPAPPSL